MSGWWLSTVADVWGVAFVVSWLVWVVLAIVLHELSHGWAAIRLGDETPRALGHMTWNPLVHMGGFSLIALILIGIAWGAMPVNPSRLRGRHGDAWVALAGPAMNILLALISFIGCVVWILAADRFQIREPLSGNMARFFWIGFFLNIVLAVFNLLPAPPLDGSRVAGSFVPAYRRLFEGPNGQWIGLGLFIMIFWFVSGRLFIFTMVGSLIPINLVLVAFGHQPFDPFS